MKMTLDFAVPAQYLFEQLTNSVLYDIKQQTGKNVKPRQLPNFKFDKTFNNQVTGHFQITKYQPDQDYAYQLKTSKNTYQVSYHLTPLDAQNVKFEYQEIIQAKTKTGDANNNLLQFLIGWQRKKRFKKMRQQIVQQYQASH